MSTLRVNTIQDSTGSSSPAINGLAKAWVNFNGTGTVAIRAALNVSSITDRATGQYTVNFTTAMTDANYTSFVCLENNSYGGDDSSTTTTAYAMATRTNGTVADNDAICVVFFR